MVTKQSGSRMLRRCSIDGAYYLHGFRVLRGSMMLVWLKNRFVSTHLVRDSRGANLFEHSILLAFLAVVTLGTLTQTGISTRGAYEKTCSELNGSDCITLEESEELRGEEPASAREYNSLWAPPPPSNGIEIPAANSESNPTFGRGVPPGVTVGEAVGLGEEEGGGNPPSSNMMQMMGGSGGSGSSPGEKQKIAGGGSTNGSPGSLENYAIGINPNEEMYSGEFPEGGGTMPAAPIAPGNPLRGNQNEGNTLQPGGSSPNESFLYGN